MFPLPLKSSTTSELCEAKSNDSYPSRLLADSTLSGSAFVGSAFACYSFACYAFTGSAFTGSTFADSAVADSTVTVSAVAGSALAGSVLAGSTQFLIITFGSPIRQMISSSTDLEAVTYQFALAGPATKQEPAKAEYDRFEQFAITVSELFVRGTCQKSSIMYSRLRIRRRSYIYQFWTFFPGPTALLEST